MSKPSDPLSPSPSTRSSLDQHASTAPTSRRHRLALRDYYNLPAAQSKPLGSNASAATSVTSLDSTAQAQSVPQINTPTSLLAPLDAPGFDADKYIERLLATGSLQDLLKVQASLTQEIGGIDGERKGLVYDNYGRLIGARDVVGTMGAWLGGKEGMEKLGHLRDGVGSLPPRVHALVGAEADGEARRQELEAAEKKRKQREVVAWALAGPQRVRQLVARGNREEAVAAWNDVEGILEKFGEVKGVEELRARGQEALKEAEAPS